jgi:seryl-tRNA synthetase
MNSINFNPSGAPATGLPTAHSQSTDSQALDALENEFTSLMNSAAPAPAAAATAPSSALQTKLDSFEEALNAVINPSNDLAKKLENIVDLRSQFQEMQNDPEFKQLMAENPDRAADMNRAAERLFAPEGLGDRALAMEFAVSWNVLVKGEPKFPNNPESPITD